MYATEQLMLGVNTGYAISGDYIGRGSLLCKPEDEAEVSEASIRAMFANGIHSLHLRYLPRAEETAPLGGLAVRRLDALVPGDRMVLGPSYDGFLATLGKHTRRNVRYYSRKAHQAGIEFVAELSAGEYDAAVRRLNRATDFPAEEPRLECDERLMTLHGGASRMGLRGKDGKLVAVLCGFRHRDRYHFLTQLNDVSCPELSLSQVLRGMAVEELIARGVGEVQFVGGTSLAFGRFCVPETYRSVLADRKTGLSAIAKRVFYALVLCLARFRAQVPVKLEMLCGAFLDEQRTKVRTALKPAAVAFPVTREQQPALLASRLSEEPVDGKKESERSNLRALVGGERFL
jgi:Acetyltransferase (GNAT) domain